LAEQALVAPTGEKVRLKDYDPGYTGEFDSKQEVKEVLKADQERLAELQDVLFADGRYALLVVLQGMDTSGKDGTIEHVFKSVNPQGVVVTPFKQPTSLELAHDFLWRVHQAAPQKGYIGIFNRSHYEDVLVVRVHDLVPKNMWKQRYEYINDFERTLSENGTIILKFFLYISKDEQKERLQARLDDPNKQWKFALGDLKERELWDEYSAAYEDALTECNTEYAPWYIVPANHKWYRNYVVIRTIIETLETLNLRYPPPKDDLSNVVIPD
jgi:PPK2 family polyphosphate:nucleotide phosphotransferase